MIRKHYDGLNNMNIIKAINYSRIGLVMNVKAEWIQSMQKFFASNRRVSMMALAGWLKLWPRRHAHPSNEGEEHLEQKAHKWLRCTNPDSCRRALCGQSRLACNHQYLSLGFCGSAYASAAPMALHFHVS